MLAALAALIVGGAVTSRHPIPLPKLQDVGAQHAPNIPPEQQPNRAGEAQVAAAQQAQNGSQPAPTIPQRPSADSEGKSGTNPDNSANEASEFWPPFWGFRLKVTDSLLAAFTALLFFAAIWQAIQLRRTIDKMDEVGAKHAGHMAASSRQATRAADAMGRVAVSMAQNVEKLKETVEINRGIAQNQTTFWRRQMRAYLSVDPGGIFDQDTTPESRFESQPIIQNTGLTPAYEVEYFARTTLAVFPLPATFDFTLIRGDDAAKSVTTVNPRGHTFMIVTAEAYYSAAEKEEYRKPGGRRLFTYGNVTYRDINDDRHTTNFCFYAIWGSKDLPIFIRTSRHNDSD